MSLTVLCHGRWNRPPAALQINIRPAHRSDFSGPLRGQELHLERLRGRRRDTRFLLSIFLGVFIIGRLDHQTQVLKRGPALQHSPSDYLRRVWFDIVSPLPEAMRFAYRLLGPED